jgi:hypothetical protein
MAINITLPDNEQTLPFNEEGRWEAVISDCQGGIYVFKNDHGNVLYVGKTSDFKRRFREHRRSSSFAHLIHEVTIYSVDDPAERDIYETYAIKLFKPMYNVSKTYFHGEIYGIIAQKLEDIERQISALEEEKAEIEYEFKLIGWDKRDEYYDEEDKYEEFLDNRDFIELGDCLYKIFRLSEIESEIDILKKEMRKIKTRFHI